MPSEVAPHCPMQVHGPLLERLYALYVGIVELQCARLCDFLAQLRAGAFLQCTLDSLMLGAGP